ncbi:MAG: hypothetical protein OER86_03730 [Phycisphaerae bacterium]|nr:hypothetical protein [Phycisphaerae bacterium]
MTAVRANTQLIVAILVLQGLGQSVLAAPPFPLGELFRRAENIYFVRLASWTKGEAKFEITGCVRGNDKVVKLVLQQYAGEQPRPEKPAFLLIFSQGDNHWGKPKPVFTVRQLLSGQASYRGWILMPRYVFAERSEKWITDYVKNLAKQNPHNPDPHRPPPQASNQRLQLTGFASSV